MADWAKDVEMNTLISFVLITLGFALDILSSYLYCRRISRDKGPSGLPLIPLLLQITGFSLISGKINILLGIIVVLISHVFLQFYIPYIARSRRTPQDR